MLNHESLSVFERLSGQECLMKEHCIVWDEDLIFQVVGMTTHIETHEKACLKQGLQLH